MYQPAISTSPVSALRSQTPLCFPLQRKVKPMTVQVLLKHYKIKRSRAVLWLPCLTDRADKVETNELIRTDSSSGHTWMFCRRQEYLFLFFLMCCWSRTPMLSAPQLTEENSLYIQAHTYLMLLQVPVWCHWEPRHQTVPGTEHGSAELHGCSFSSSFLTSPCGTTALPSDCKTEENKLILKFIQKMPFNALNELH